MNLKKSKAVGLGARTAIVIGIASGFTQAALAAPGDLIGDPIVAGTISQTGGNPQIASDASGNSVVAWVDGAGNIVAQRYAEDGTPRGSQFQIAAAHASGDGEVTSPAVAVNASGQFTVAWADMAKSYGWAIGAYGIGFEWYRSPGTVHAKTFQADGTPVSGDVQVASTPYGSLSPDSVAVAMDDDGDFVATWIAGQRSIAFDQYVPADFNERSGVYARIYSASGKPKTLALTVDSGTLKARHAVKSGREVYDTAVGMDGAGNFTVVWNAADYTAGTSLVDGRSYNAKGKPDGATFSIGDIYAPWSPVTIAMNRSGQYVVGWLDGNAVLSARSYGTGDVAVSGKISVASDLSLSANGSAYNNGPAVAIDASGNFIASSLVNVTADNYNGYASVKSVRLFTADGTPLSASVLLPNNDGYESTSGTVAMDAAGDAVAAYSNFQPNSSAGELVLQRVAGP
jgi:hypothetical protein